MGCEFDYSDDNGVHALLSFKRENLLYDIRNNAYIEGSVLETENHHGRHMVQDVGEEGNVDRVTRVLDLCVARCREMLYAYTKHEVRERVMHDDLRESPVYGILLSLPSGVSQTTLKLLEKLVHEYLVCSAVADWLGITNPAKAELWSMRASSASDEIGSLLMSRRSGMRRPLHPF